VIPELPIDAWIVPVVDAVRSSRAAVVTAAPGAGKTTRVPPALAADGPVLLLQPRRVAARAIARRIADERGWTVGQEVGWHVRFERRFSRDTRLIVATEGVLTARLQQDPLLTGFRTVIIDEFHERSLHADVGLALVRQAWRARQDLRVVVMSATLDARRVAAFLDDCPIIDVPGRAHSLDITFRPGVAVDQAVVDALPNLTGALLCFLPGAPEIRRATDALASRPAARSAPVWPLHGGLDADAQDAALQPTGRPRVILATNVAETTLTVPDVTHVIDTGLHKVARYDPERAIDSLETERVSLDSADQRAGRAGRTGPGVVWRLWDSRDRLLPHREPEIVRVDLAATVLDILAWGGDPRALEWYEPPPPDALTAAIRLLARLGALDSTTMRLTPSGERLRSVPLHPRLGRILLEARGATVAARACALLSERHFVPPRLGATACDLLSAVDREASLPPHVQRIARDVGEAARSALGGDVRDRISDDDFRRAVLAGYPDRVARRRAPRSDRFVLASGAGARLSRDSGVVDAEFVVATDVGAGGSMPGGEALIRLATSVDRDWLTPTAEVVQHEFDAASGRVRAARLVQYGELTLDRHDVTPDRREAARLMADAYRRRGPTIDDEALFRRLRFAGVPVDVDELVDRAAVGAVQLDGLDLAAHLPPDAGQQLARDAPARLRVPSGREVALEYEDDSRVVASVKLQEVFGLAASPRIGSRRVPVTFKLLAPNGRPVQVTSDLGSFWRRGYVEVRKELRARYPKHPWPEDPRTATPTRRTIKRRS